MKEEFTAAIPEQDQQSTGPGKVPVKTTDKHWIRDLAIICAKKGVQHVVMSPGSRCAPLVAAFARQPEVQCHSVIDERSAAFFALGMAQQLRQPVALVCTSGTALLNYAPAVAEAHYQRLPLIVLSADRPNELIDQGDSQTIRQRNVYQNYIKASFELPNDANNEPERTYSNRMVNEAINIATMPAWGPVHINIPLREPLYGLKDYSGEAEPGIIHNPAIRRELEAKELSSLQQIWAKSKKRLIIAGGMPLLPELKEVTQQLSEASSTVVLAEVNSKLQGGQIINCIDPVLESIPQEEKADHAPELLITFGGSVISKKLKRFLRQHPPKEHWHIDNAGWHTDTYFSLSRVLRIDEATFLKALAEINAVSTDFSSLWKKAEATAYARHDSILQESPYCDLTVFGAILKALPAESHLQLANSTPVRYAGLFPPQVDKNLTIFSNRGTSGIDGTISTAAGAAFASGKITTVITGDISFFYDSNALWNKQLPENLRIILINNSGGNIFRIIPGPSDWAELEPFFETRYDLSAEHIAKAYEIPYYFCDSLEGVQEKLASFYEPQQGKCAILEIKTPNDISANILKKYLNL